MEITNNNKNQQPITNNQKSTNNNKQSIINNQQSIIRNLKYNKATKTRKGTEKATRQQGHKIIRQGNKQTSIKQQATRLQGNKAARQFDNKPRRQQRQ